MFSWRHSMNIPPTTKTHGLDQIRTTSFTVLVVLTVFLIISILYLISFHFTTTDLEKSISAAGQARDPEPHDLAYCSGKGRLIQVVESDTQTAAICLNGTDIIYHGLTRTTGGTIVLPAEKIGREVVEATVGQTTYRLTENGMSILDNGVVSASAWTDESVYRNKLSQELPGDLGISQEISYPKCDGKIVLISNPLVGEAIAKQELPEILKAHPGWKYLRTDLSCDNFYASFATNTGGDHMYVAYDTQGYSEEVRDEMCKLIDSPGYEGYVVDRLQDGVQPEGRLCDTM